MKKLILITSCVALFAVASYAQDTTKTKPSQQQSDQIRKDNMKGWTQVQSTEVPANLRTTLSGTQYSGWEMGTIYKNESGEYRLNTTSGTSGAAGTNGKTYYFDKNGKATTKPNGSGTNPH
ncbi:MAG: hypothetical protein WDO15_05835 [Bacteroidota bacterium]